MNRRGHFSLTPATPLGWLFAALVFGPAFLVMQFWPMSLSAYAFPACVIITVAWVGLLLVLLGAGVWMLLRRFWGQAKTRWNFVLLLALLASPAVAQPTTYDYTPICSGFCGPAAIAWSIRDNLTDHLTLARMEEIGRLMDWQHHHRLGGIREDLQDSPAAHKLAVLKAGWRYIPRSCADIMTGVAAPNRTVILIHPNARHPYLAQHWVVLAGRTPVGGVLVHWGTGSIRELPDFQDQFFRGKPQCAYEVYKPSVPQKSRVTIWNKLWDWIARKLA